MAIAPDELQTLDEEDIARLEGAFEYIDGRYIEKPNMGARSNELSLLLMAQLVAFVRANRLGRCFTDNLTYRIFQGDPKKTRIPDGSFIRTGRLPGDKSPPGDLSIVPDLAIEVASPGNLVENMEERINDLMGAGVGLLWMIAPEARVVYVHRADGTVSRLTDADELSGEDVIPGFACPLGELFDSV